MKLVDYPGDGGWCMAEYVGNTAPKFVLYSDGQLLVENDSGKAWYSEAQLDLQEYETLLDQIENSGFFTVIGDGSEYEQDAIYQIPENAELSMGGGSFAFEARKDGVSKRVMIYSPYMDYLIPEISGALQSIESFQSDNWQPYYPVEWVVWADDTNPCDWYQWPFSPWPEQLGNIGDLLDGSTKFTMQGGAGEDIQNQLGFWPGRFTHREGIKTYFIFTRPLLPHETPYDFPEY